LSQDYALYARLFERKVEEGGVDSETTYFLKAKKKGKGVKDQTLVEFPDFRRDKHRCPFASVPPK
jgi:hypothetical protein